MQGALGDLAGPPVPTVTHDALGAGPPPQLPVFCYGWGWTSGLVVNTMVTCLGTESSGKASALVLVQEALSPLPWQGGALVSSLLQR